MCAPSSPGHSDRSRNAPKDMHGTVLVRLRVRPGNMRTRTRIGAPNVRTGTSIGRHGGTTVSVLPAASAACRRR